MSRLKDLIFPVRVEDEALNCNTEYSKRVIGSINGVDTLLNQCSPRYELVPNELIFPEIENVLNGADISFSADYQHKNHVRFYADYTINSKDFGLAVGEGGDIIKPVVKVRHSYNGLTKYALTVGFFRLICSNGLVIPFDLGKEFNLMLTGKHTSSIRHSIEELKFMLDKLINSSDAIAAINNRFNVLAEKKVNDVADRIEKTLKTIKIDGESITNLLSGERGSVTDFVMEVVETEKNKLGYTTINDWLVYNGVNQYLNRTDKNTKAPEQIEALDQTQLAYLMAS